MGNLTLLAQKIDELTQEISSLREAVNKLTAKKETTRGTRLPEDWRPSPATLQWADEESGLNYYDLQLEFKRFHDYWSAVSGHKGVKQNWDATFRNWIRKAAESKSRPSNNRWKHLNEIRNNS